MRLLLQRVNQAHVEVDGETVGAIGRGLLILVGITHDDTLTEVERLAAKVANLRIFDDDAGQMNRSLLDLHQREPGSVGALVVSQFTLYADARKGRRPNYVQAAGAALASPLVDRFADALRALGVPVATGVFGAEMSVSLVNDGPVTIWLDSADLKPPQSVASSDSSPVLPMRG